MKFASILSLATLAAASPLATPLEGRQASYYTLTSYSGAQCKLFSGYDVFYKGICSKLDYYARSIKLEKEDIPKGCTLYGYSSDYCSGYELFKIAGPADKKKCYDTVKIAGFQGYIQSVKLVCSKYP